MKLGDMVRVRDGNVGITSWLYGGDEQCWDERGSLIPTDIPFGFGDVGVVLKKKKMVPGPDTNSYVKLLTARGTGWIFENRLEPI